MAVDLEDVQGARGHGDARGDGPGVMPRKQLATLGLDDVVAAAAIREDAKLVVHLLGPVQADGDANPVFREIVDDLRGEKCGIGRKAKVDLHSPLFRLLPGIVDNAAEQWKIHEGLAAKKSYVNGAAPFGLREQIIYRGLGRLPVHEFLLAFGRGDLVLAKLVTILTGQIALIRYIEYQRLQRKMLGQRWWRINDGRAVANRAYLAEFVDAAS